MSNATIVAEKNSLYTQELDSNSQVKKGILNIYYRLFQDDVAIIKNVRVTEMPKHWRTMSLDLIREVIM